MEKTHWSGADSHCRAHSSRWWGWGCVHSHFKLNYHLVLACKLVQHAWWECLHPCIGPNYCSVPACELAQHADWVGLWGTVPLGYLWSAYDP